MTARPDPLSSPGPFSPSPASVGFVGVGQMGRPMVDRLADAAHDPVVCVRRPELADELTAAGITVVPSPAELASGVDVLIACVFSDAQLEEVMVAQGAMDALRPGAILVSHVTGAPGVLAGLAERRPDVQVLDAPVSGGAADIEAGALTVLVGGEAAALERVRPALAAYADPIVHVGPLGDAMRMKLLNNLLFTVHLRVAVQAAALAESLDIAPADLARVLADCSGDSYALRRLAGGAPPDRLRDGALPFLVKDVAVVRDVAASMGIELGELGALASWVDEADVSSP